ncbi:hypothetical protein [Subsaximicrobium wynnwilliamsii]|uniref:hypothetical protein n=1 Tax=Subsaximicrobium wynnwilliamsii TaxID=291179 RepID=UPI0011BD86C3|nr:hypothetical protein [Subsaximicrobium wynnwilliamsii]
MTDLTNKENELYLFTINLYNGKVNSGSKDLTLDKVYAEYKNVHKEYAKMANKDIESLKRGLFIQWYSMTEPNYLTGIAELDEKSELKIIAELKNRIDKNTTDNELNWMLNHYLEWNYVFEKFKNIADLRKKENLKNLTNKKPKMINRGQMGIYWNSIIEE